MLPHLLCAPLAHPFLQRGSLDTAHSTASGASGGSGGTSGGLSSLLQLQHGARSVCSITRSPFDLVSRGLGF